MGRVRLLDFAASRVMAKGGIGPEDWPKFTRWPRRARHSSEPSKVSWPTES